MDNQPELLLIECKTTDHKRSTFRAIAEGFAGTRFGQYAIGRGERALSLLEKTAIWCRPVDDNEKDVQPYPLPWAVLLILVLIFRAIETVCCFLGLLLGDRSMLTLQDIANILHKSRCGLRALRLHGRLRRGPRLQCEKQTEQQSLRSLKAMQLWKRARLLLFVVSLQKHISIRFRNQQQANANSGCEMGLQNAGDNVVEEQVAGTDTADAQCEHLVSTPMREALCEIVLANDGSLESPENTHKIQDVDGSALQSQQNDQNDSVHLNNEATADSSNKNLQSALVCKSLGKANRSQRAQLSKKTAKKTEKIASASASGSAAKKPGKSVDNKTPIKRKAMKAASSSAVQQSQPKPQTSAGQADRTQQQQRRSVRSRPTKKRQ